MPPILKVHPATYMKYRKDFEADDTTTIEITEAVPEGEFIVQGDMLEMFGEPTSQQKPKKIRHPNTNNKSDRKRNKKNRWR